MGREEIKEFISAFLCAFTAILDIRVSGGVKLKLHFINLQSAIPIFIQFLECLSHKVCSIVREWSQNGIHELLELDSTISVLIKDTKDLLSFFLWATYFIILKCLLKLLEVQCPWLIWVHDLELPLQANETLNTTLEDLLLESLQVYFILFLCSHCVEWLWMLNFVLCILNMITVLMIDIAHKWIVFTFLPSDYLIISLTLTNMFVVCEALSQWTALSLVVLGLGISEWEFWADHTRSDSRLTSGVYVFALVSTALWLCSLWPSVAIIFIGPTFAILFVLGSITI